MGVKHLTSFVKANKIAVPQSHTIAAPTIPGLVIDGLAFAFEVLSWLKIPPVGGAEYAHFNRAIKSFFDRTSSLGIKCCVVIDGASGAEKLDTQVRPLMLAHA